MNKTSNVIVNILTEFKGLNNLKKAENSFDTLTRSVKAFVGAYTVERVVQSSINAFKEQQAVLAGYNNSLVNLGTSYADLAPVIDKTTQKFIDLGFQDNQTIEALTKLTTALGNPAKALDVLATTADLARYKNMGLAETGTLVAKAISGNSRAFADLGLKIDKTLTPQNAFNKLLDQAKQKAGGAADAYAKTLGGSLDIAAAKAENASESLGKALAPSLQKLAEFAVKYVVPAFNLIADNITPILGVATALLSVAAAMKAVGLASAIMTGELALNPLFAAAAGVGLVAGLLLKKSAPSTGSPLRAAAGRGGVVGAYQGVTATSKKTEETKKLTDAENTLAKFEKQWNADSLKAANQQKIADAAKIKAEKDKIALEKAKLVLQQAGKAVDVQQAQLVAALMNSSDPQVVDRLKLQQALLNDDADAAGKLAQKVLEAQKELLTLQGKDPFSNWGTATAIDEINKLTEALKNLGIAKATAGLSGTTAAGTAYTNGSMLASGAIVAQDAQGYGVLAPASGAPSVVNNYNIGGSVISERALSDVVASNSASGITQNITRLNYNFGQ